jgi:hypothetical protein
MRADLQMNKRKIPTLQSPRTGADATFDGAVASYLLCGYSTLRCYRAQPKKETFADTKHSHRLMTQIR